MKTEKDKMLAGELYDPFDTQLSDERLRTRLLIKQLNDTREDETEIPFENFKQNFVQA